MKSVKDEMTVKLDTIRNNFALINSMVSEKKDEALRLFWGDLDVAKAMTMINRYEAQKREIEQRMAEQQRKDKEAEEERQRLNRERELEREKQKVRDEELARIRRENEIKTEAEQKAAVDEERIREEERLATEKRLMSIKMPEPVADLEAPFDADEITAVFTVTGTAEELQQVEMYLNSIGVEFQKEV
jgi:septal ring factor EnvC (AmiA/AmiB activator)